MTTYVIGENENVSTWGALRSVLFSNGTTLFPLIPDGFIINYHNKVFPPTDGEGDFSPFYFTPDSGTLLRAQSYVVSTPRPIIYFAPTEPEPSQPTVWNGFIVFAEMDAKDFFSMIGKTIASPQDSTTINLTAGSFPGQDIRPMGIGNWGYGLTSVQSFKLVT